MNACPLCQSPVDAPEIDEVIEARGIGGHAAAILRALWSARGMSVNSEALFDAIYADDEDGGPAIAVAYPQFKLAFTDLRQRLIGSGVDAFYAKGCGAGRGYRLLLGSPQQSGLG